jgi:SanA protein
MFRKFFKWFFALSIIVAVVLFSCYRLVETSAKPYLYSNVADVPMNKVGLLLGTSKTLASGFANPFFKNRITAAVELYKAGKIKYIIASGDNSVVNYNEPQQMKTDLIQQGVPDSVIFLDYAGFRTLDSILRCKEIFGQTSFTVISQPFHNERAVFIAQKNGMSAVAFNATDVSKRNGFKTDIREIFARTKAVLDIYVLNTKPKFGGKK